MKYIFGFYLLLLSLLSTAQQLSIESGPAAKTAGKGGVAVTVDGQTILNIGTSSENEVVIRKGSLSAAPSDYKTITLSPAPDLSQNHHKLLVLKDCFILLYELPIKKGQEYTLIKPLQLADVYAAKFSADGTLLKQIKLITEPKTETNKNRRDLELRYAVSEDKSSFVVMSVSAIADYRKMDVSVFNSDFEVLMSNSADMRTVSAGLADPSGDIFRTTDLVLSNDGVAYITSLVNSSRVGRKAGLGAQHGIITSVSKSNIVTQTLKATESSVCDLELLIKNNTVYVAGLYGDPQVEKAPENIAAYIHGAFAVCYTKTLLSEFNYANYPLPRAKAVSPMGLQISELDVLQDGSVIIGVPGFFAMNLQATSSGGMYMFKLNEDPTKNYSYCCQQFQWYERNEFLGPAWFQFQVIGNDVFMVYNQTYQYLEWVEKNKRAGRIQLANTWRMSNCVAWQTTLDANGKVKSEGRIFKDDETMRLWTYSAYKENNTLYFFGENSKGALVARSILK